jgi:hypothetical protein
MELATVETVEEAADAVGWPVVLKGLVPGVAHKTEHGLVAVGVERAQLEEATARIAAAAGALGASAVQLLVQGMASDGVELVLSVRRDPRLGSFVGVGLGGTFVEVLKDIRYAPHPLDPAKLDTLLDSLAGRELLTGYRGGRGINRAWVAKTLDALVAVAERLGLSELEVNPAFAREDGGVVVDALAVKP